MSADHIVFGREEGVEALSGRRPWALAHTHATRAVNVTMGATGGGQARRGQKKESKREGGGWWGRGKEKGSS
jgi:hypothetical protein